jgi:hypothetical protein
MSKKIKLPKPKKYSRTENNGKIAVKNLKTGKTRTYKKKAKRKSK